jgi:hypothetical protein
VFDPLAIALVIAANFAFAQLTKRDETPVEEQVDDLEEEMKEWEEASLTDLHILEKEEQEENFYGEDISYPSESPNEEFIKALDNINQINDSSADFFWKKRMIDSEIERMKAYEQSLQEKRKTRQQEDDTITY